MPSTPDPILLTRVVRADDWNNRTTEQQETEWDFLREAFRRRAAAAKSGDAPELWIGLPVETVDYDEGTGDVILRMQADVELDEDTPA